jgi:hypothetical protein
MKLKESHLDELREAARELPRRQIEIKVTKMKPSLWCFLAVPSLMV